MGLSEERDGGCLARGGVFEQAVKNECSYSKYFLRACSVPSCGPGTWDLAVNWTDTVATH